jgi:hypothetical protein
MIGAYEYELGKDIIPVGDFEVEDYLAERSAQSDFLMLEIGHSGGPAAYQQLGGFTDKRPYVGIEAWLRDPYRLTQKEIDKLATQADREQNIFYISHNLGGKVERDFHGGEYESWYEGKYDPATLLPDECADEVFIGNVFSDPMVAYSKDRTASLLHEAARLTGKGGMVVMRETITPHRVRYVSEELVREAGLVLLGVINPDEAETWDKLEQVFSVESFQLPPKPEYFYAIYMKS